MTDDVPEFLPPGTPIDLDNCAREAIHTPGSIQSHGVLIVARSADRIVTQVSANASTLLPSAAPGLSLDELLGAHNAEALSSSALEPGSTSIRPARITLPSGEAVDTHTFRPAEHLVAVELEAAVGDEPGAITTLGRVAQWSAALRGADGVGAMVDRAAQILRDLTGFDRVWAYRFEPDGHGVVVAEHRLPELEEFLGLHFPEGDIPAQARALYVRNAVRVIPDAAATTAALEPVQDPETGDWTDLSASTLRAVSPMHIRYLTNMGVRASMSVSLVVDGRLWGLLSGHHYAGPKAVSIGTRSECELLSVLASMQLTTATELDRTREYVELQAASARVIDALAATDDLDDGLLADPEALLGLCGASGAILVTGEHFRTTGQVPGERDIARLVRALSEIEGDIVITEAIADHEPSLADLTDVAAGVIAFPLSRSQGNWVIWVRPETIEEVTWANRDKELVRRAPGGEMELGERESFERWAETVEGRSRVWTASEIAEVQSLRSALGSLLITRTERLARLNDELTRSNAELDAFAYAAAHDLREPIRGIEQYADFYLEDFADDHPEDELPPHVETIRRLARRMDGLLVSLLDYAQIGEARQQPQPVHLPTIVDGVRELLAARVGAGTRIEVEDAIVKADAAGLQQLLLNLVWNATKYSSSDEPIMIGTATLTEAEAGTPRVRRSVLADEEPHAVYVRDRGIGIDPQHHEDIFQLFRRLHSTTAYGGGSGAGLALCRRIVDRHGGHIWVDSAPGKGATFWFTLGPA